jgi:hypothetical protein
VIPARRKFVYKAKCWRVEVRTVLTRVGALETQRLDPLAGTQLSDAITITIAATPSPLQNVRDYCLPVFRAINVHNTRKWSYVGA